MSNTLNFVLASPNDAADKIDDMEARIEMLEAALRNIARGVLDTRQHQIARTALGEDNNDKTQ